jgi:hypothetical protein
VLARRSRPPYAFGGSDIGWLRLSGDGTVTGALAVDADSLELKEPPADLTTTFGLPIPSRDWYFAGPDDPVEAAMKRVSAGAPKLFGPPDWPDFDFDQAGANDETDRISALRHTIGGYLDQVGNSMPGASTVQLRTTTAGVENRVELDPVQALLMMAADPGIARYLGLATTVPQTNQEDLPDLCLVAALWLLPLDRRPTPDSQPFPGQTLRELLADCQTPAWVLDSLYGQFPGLQGRAARMLNRAQAAAPADGWTLQPLLAVACAAGLAPPDLPDPPGLSAPGQLPGPPGGAPSPARRWQVSSAGKQWAQTLLLPDGEPLGPVGFARTAPGEPTSLHRKGPAGPSGTVRGITLLPSFSPQFQAATVSDLHIPADPGGAAWRLWQADEWGRWSEASGTSAVAPDPAPPPTPSLEVLFQPIQPAAPAGPTSPGNLAIRIGIPHAGSDPISENPSAPGGAPVSAAQVTIDGGAPIRLDVPAAADSVTHLEPLGPMDVAAQRTVTCTATLIDRDGLTSAVPASADCLVSDGRTHPPAKTAPTLLFASAEDATGQSEIGLQWPATASGYRVYIADESRLADALGLQADGDLRCQRAAVIWQGSGELSDKSSFTLITGTPIQGDPDGQVRLRHRVPATLSNVQFIRIVPVTAAGAETPFAQCGLVPVAVPYIDRPLPPRLSVRPRADGKADVAIEVSGVPADRLRAVVPAGQTAVLAARLRRTRSGDLEPAYIPITNSDIPLDENGEVFAATTADGPATGLTPFVRYTWIAEARYPAEPAQPPGTVPPAGGDLVRPLYGTPGDASEGTWSESSQPASTLVTSPPPAAPAATATVNAGATTITIAAAPLAAQDAIGAYRAQVLRHGNNGYELITDQPIQATPFTYTDNMAADSYAVIVIDPLGISSQPTTISPS